MCMINRTHGLLKVRMAVPTGNNTFASPARSMPLANYMVRILFYFILFFKTLMQ